MKPIITTRALVCAVIACATLNTTRPARADYASTVMSFNPAAYWRLDETAVVPPGDLATNRGSAGAAAAGYYLKGAVHAYPAAMAGSSAAYFTGGAWVRVPNGAALNPSPPFSVEFWINPNPVAGVLTCPLSSTDFSVTPRLGWLFYTDDGYTGGYVNGGYYFRVYSTAGTFAVASPAGLLTPAWTHVVGVVDGVNVVLYVNGQSVGTTPWSGTFTPNVIQSIGIGTRYDAGFPFDGSMDDIAIYGTALSASAVKAHYDAATTNAAGYAAQILAANPVGYWRLDEPYYSPPDPSTLPVAANIGTLGTDANGVIYPGLTTGVAGPPFSGLGAGNHACQFSGIAGYIDCGASPGLDLTFGPFSIMAWIKVNRFDVSWQSIVTKGDSAWRVHRNSSGADTPNVGFGTTGLSNVDGAGARNVNDGQWHQMVCVYDGSTKNIYLDGLLDTSTPATGTLATDAYNVMIGENSQVTGRNFNGLIDEVAIFTNALSAAQIQQIFYTANVSPIIVQQPQAPAGTIIAGSPLSLTVVAAGNPNLGYQWTKEGISLPDRTTATLSFSNVTTNDAGNYAVVVTNAYGGVTSSVVALSILYPTSPAALVRATGYPVYNPATQTATLTQIILEFDGPLGAEGSNPAHYGIPGLTVSGARFTNLNQTVMLTTAPQTQGAVYNLTITGVTDGVGQPLANNTAQFRGWVASPANGVVFEYYPGYGGTTIDQLTNNPYFPDSPGLTTNLWAFDSRIMFPDDTHEYYGARMRTYFTPDTSGNWRFFLRSDDSSQVFLNPNGTDAAGRTLILDETGCCGDWNKYQSPAFPLVAGQSYYLEMLYKEGGGGDYGKVAARMDGTGYPALGTANAVIDPAAATGPAIGYPYAPADVGGALSVVGPTDVTVQANHLASFSVSATGPAGQEILYQWKRNGVDIPGATSASYALYATTGDNGVPFSVQVSKPGSVAIPAATLHVTPDTDLPTVVTVHGSRALNTVTVGFSELMQAAQDPSWYTLGGVNPVSATVDSTGTNVILTFLPPLAAGQSYNLVVQGALDLSGHAVANVTVPVRTFVFSRGLLRYDYFPYLSPSDNSITQLTSDPRYPNSPDATYFLTAFNSRTLFPDDSHDAYGAHVTGLFVPPTNGNYIFYLRSDDSSQLWMNPAGLDPAGSAFLVEETGCCHSFSALASPPQTLTAGQWYFIEAMMKEGNGGDYVQVAAKLDSDPANPDSLFPIAGNLLGVLADPVGASVTITQQPENVLAVYRGADTPQAVFNENFNATNGGLVMSILGTPTIDFAPWAWDSTRGTWSCSGSNSCFGPIGSGLTLPAITMAKSGGVVLTFAHRYSFEGYNASDGTAWDGGQVRLSVNGGPFASVPAAAFTANGYIGPIGGTVNTNLTTTPGWINMAFVGESPDYGLETYLTSVASLGFFNAGDTLRIQFATSWDDCSEGTEPNWEIDSAQVTVGAAVPVAVSLTVGAESTYQNLPNPYQAYVWQEDTGSGFTDLSGANSATCLLNFWPADSGERFRCIVYGPGASATSAVATVTVTLPLAVARTAPSTLKLSWPLPPPPLSATSFLLEKSATLLPGSWSTVATNTYQTTSTQVYVPATVAPADPPTFYRLRRN